MSFKNTPALNWAWAYPFAWVMIVAGALPPLALAQKEGMGLAHLKDHRYLE
jgi:Mg2+ and Co2+ transporter CorA